MNVGEVEFSDHSKEVLDAMNGALLRALEKCGMTAEAYAKKLCPVDKGDLRNSITHKVDTSELAAYVGTNKEYAAYVELGTGIYYPGGRKTPWAYVDDEGERHFTHGQKPQPYLKPAVTEHKEQYRNIIKNELRNG